MRNAGMLVWGIAALVVLAAPRCPPSIAVDPHGCSQPLPTPGPIALEWPRARMVFQQHDRRGDVRVRGRLTGIAPGAMLARYRGGAWQRIDTDPETGVFDGVIAAQPLGWGVVEVQLERDARYRTGVAPVGVGNIVVLAGQSNMVMYLSARRTTGLHTAMLGQRRNPDDPEAFVWADDPIHDCTQTTGSIWPDFGDRVVLGTGGVPVLLVATAVPATGLIFTGQWLPDGELFEAMLAQLSLATAGQMCASALLWLQGELDAQFAIPADAYRDGLIAFAAGLQDATGCAIPVIAGSIGDVTHGTGITADAVAAIRAGTLDAIAASPHLHAGPWTADLPIAYYHFTDAASDALLERWCDSVAAAPTGLVCSH